MVQPEDNRIRNSRLGRLVATALRSYFLPIPRRPPPSQPHSSALFLRALFYDSLSLADWKSLPPHLLSPGRGGITSNYKKLSADQIRWRGGVLITTQKSGLDQLGTRLLSPAVNSFPSLVRGCTPFFLPSFLPFILPSFFLHRLIHGIELPAYFRFCFNNRLEIRRHPGDKRGLFSSIHPCPLNATRLSRSFCPTAFKTGRL